MCGICGIYDLRKEPRVDKNIIRHMNDTLIHRGPDDEGIFIDGRIGFGHRRLSIIDIGTGHQPMANEDETVWIVFNGEIYNFLELRKELEPRHSFKTKSDTEVIIHLYEQEGIRFLNRLRGMFALALWDKKKEELILARDRIGKKPLYYFWNNNQCIFASEIKAILAHPDVSVQYSPAAIHHYLTYQYIPAPLTAFEGVQKLLPASYSIIRRDGSLHSERWWHISFKNKLHCTEQEYALKIREKLEEATRLRMISDVPLGAFLSGGIDSSIIVGIMSGLSSKPVKTFSIGFDSKDYDETCYVRIVAERFKTEHHELSVKPDAVSLIPKLVWHYDEPYADVSAMPSFYLAQETRKYVTVALNGDGGDENFAGYDRYKAHMIPYYYLYGKLPAVIKKSLLPFLVQLIPDSLNRRNIWKRLKRFITAAGLTPQERNFMLVAYFNPDELSELYTSVFASQVRDIDVYGYLASTYSGSESDDLLDQLQYADFMTYLPEDLTVKMDVASMAHGLETRSPFLDHQVVELAASIPSRYKISRSLISKYILKEAYRDMLPPEILTRKKMGFGVPICRWFRRDLYDYIAGILLSAKATKRGIIRTDRVKQLLEEHRNGKADHSDKLWVLLMLEMWFTIFIDKEKA